jgi:hypothetical protein
MFVASDSLAFAAPFSAIDVEPIPTTSKGPASSSSLPSTLFLPAAETLHRAAGMTQFASDKGVILKRGHELSPWRMANCGPVDGFYRDYVIMWLSLRD